MFVIKPYKKYVKPYESHVKIYTEMKEYISRDNDEYKNWYAGITDDYQRSLFVNHRVYEDDDSYIFRECPNNRAAENVKASLVKLGCKEICGGWMNAPTIVYAYRKAFNTNP